MAYQGVTLKNIRPWEDPTFVLNNAITEEDVGKAVTQDSASANTVKIAGAGDTILGRLENVEDRTKTEGNKVGRVKIIGGMAFMKSESETIAVGDMVVAAAGGLVAKAGTSDKSDLTAWEVSGNAVIVLKTH